MRFPHRLNRESRTMTDNVTPPFDEALQASVLIGTAEKMIEIWTRLPSEKQAALLAASAAKKMRWPPWSPRNCWRPPSPD